MTEPMSMVEKVARALWLEAASFKDKEAFWATMSEGDRAPYVNGANAAIKAMREPTPEMIRLAIRRTDDEPTDFQRDIGAEAIAGMPPLAPHRQRDGINAAIDIARDWRAMCDAALAPEGAEG